MVGSLEHTSELSLSLASSEGLSNSLRSVTEIKNLHSLVQSDSTAGPSGIAAATAIGGKSDISAALTISGSGVGLGPLTGIANRTQVSDDIPVPVPGTSQQHPLHK